MREIFILGGSLLMETGPGVGRGRETRTIMGFTGDSLLSHTLELLWKERPVFSSKEKEMILDLRYAWI